MGKKLDPNKVKELWELHEDDDLSTEKIYSLIEADLNADGDDWDAGDITDALIESGVFVMKEK